MKRFTLIFILLFGASCQKESVFEEGSGIIQKKPASRFDNGSDSAKDPNSVSTSTPQCVMLAKYNLVITPPSEMVLCKGELDLKVMDNFSMQFPTASVTCGTSMKMNVKSLLGQGMSSSNGTVADGTGTTQETGSNVSVDNKKILRMSRFGNAEFQPPRPFIIGPVIQKPLDFSGLKDIGQYSVSLNGTSAQGSIQMEVLEVKTRPDNEPRIELDYWDIHWAMTANGFEGINKANAFLFDKFEMYWNTRPIRIPQIIVVAQPADLMNGVVENDPQKVMNMMLGQLTIVLKLVEIKNESCD